MILTMTTSSFSPPPSTGILIIDGFSPFHSGLISDRLSSQNVGVVNALSLYMARGLERPDEVPPLDSSALKLFLQTINFPIAGVICESDAGLEFAEQLSCAIAELQPTLKHNNFNPARRDKFLLNQLLAKHNIPTVRQLLIRDENELIEALSVMKLPFILKPTHGVGSNNVHLCKTKHSVLSTFPKIKAANKWGTFNSPNDAVLVQEMAVGTEYAVDCVSKNGEHKLIAVWEYEKTDNGVGPFAYRRTGLLDDAAAAREIADYTFACLDALEVKWGMTHSEVIRDNQNPGGGMKIVEVNCRQHNAATGAICQICLACNALDAVIWSYLDSEEWDELPVYNINLKQHGCVVHFQCLVDGVVKSVNGIEEIEAMESVLEMEVYESFGVGEVVKKTLTIMNDAGWAVLIGEKDVVERDYRRIVELMSEMFETEEEMEM